MPKYVVKDFSNYSEQELLNAMKRDNFLAFNEIYKRYWKRLFAFANNILEDQDDCEDIVQDLFTELYWKRKKQQINCLKPYLFQAVKFQVIKHIRNGKISDKYITRMTAPQFVNQTEESINLKELESSIENVLLQLPDRCRQIFHMSRVEKLSHKQIAEKLGISIQTVKNQITTALNHLRDKLDDVLTIILIIFHLS